MKAIIERDRLQLGPRLSVSFQRALRIPDDGRMYPLPPGLGAFPLRRVEDFAQTVPGHWPRASVHEFGHAIGVPHEHQHPAVEIPWTGRRFTVTT